MTGGSRPRPSSCRRCRTDRRRAEALADAEIKLGLAVLKYGTARPRRAPRPAVGQPHVRPEADHLRPQDADAGDRRGRRRRCLPAQPASQAPAVRAPAAGDAGGARRQARRSRTGGEDSRRAPRSSRARSTRRSHCCASGWQFPPPPTARTRSTTTRWSTAVKAVQVQAGMEPTGIINAATRNALNGVERPTSAGNVQRLIVNMERWRWMPENLGDFYVWDSVPEQMTSVYDEGKQVLLREDRGGQGQLADADLLGRHAVRHLPPLVGRAAGHQVLRAGAGAAQRRRRLVLLQRRLLRAQGLRPARQPRRPPGRSRTRSTGRASTSTASISSSRRVRPMCSASSSSASPTSTTSTCTTRPSGTCSAARSAPSATAACGCRTPSSWPRCCSPHDKGLSTEQVQEYVRRGGEIKLTTPIPVHVTYFTAVVDDAGKLHYRPDIYALDSRVASKLEGQSVNLVTAAVDKPEARSRADPDRRAAGARGKGADQAEGRIIPVVQSVLRDLRQLGGRSERLRLTWPVSMARTACSSPAPRPRRGWLPARPWRRRSARLSHSG